MSYEVEQKFRVEGLLPVEQSLRALGARFGPDLTQVDAYFGHPARDFAVTDEALRIRQVGSDCCLTYKGPKIDTTTKTRREIELPLPAGPETVSRFASLLEALGFRRIAEVRKRRRTAEMPWNEHLVEVALDSVEGVGDFVELELSAEAEQIEPAKQCLAELALRLGLSDNERRSYLELLLGS